MGALTVIAIILSPIIAVLVSIFIQYMRENRREKRFEKLRVFNTLMRTRHTIVPTLEMVQAYNMIDVVFYKEKNIRRLWREYYNMLHDKGLDNDLGYKQRREKRLELLFEIAQVLGFGKAISHLDIERVYYPVGLGEFDRRANEIADELLRVLKASGSVELKLKRKPKSAKPKKKNAKKDE